nr:hypothetical protein [Tanacetum cinerariifolium]
MRNNIEMTANGTSSFGQNSRSNYPTLIALNMKTAKRPTVPKFGNWESDENVPYTVYFDSARKGKTGEKMINPNDLQETPKCLPTLEPHHHHHPLAPNPTPNQTSLSAKVDGKGSAFPAWEGKNSYDINHVTPGRSRMKPAKGDETVYFLYMP